MKTLSNTLAVAVILIVLAIATLVVGYFTMLNESTPVFPDIGCAFY